MADKYVDFNLYYDGTTSDIDGIITNPLHLFFQEIEIAVKVAGDIYMCKYYIDINAYLFNKYISVNRIKQDINVFIGNNCEHAQYFQYDTEVEVLNVENKDLIYIKLTVHDPDANREFIQKFLLGS